MNLNVEKPVRRPRGPRKIRPETGETPKVLAGYISEQEFANQLNCDIRTVRRWRSQSEVPPFVKIGISVYYPVEEAAAWIRKRVGR